MVKPQLFIDIIIRKRFRGHRSAGFCQNDATVNVVNQVSQTKPLGRSWSDVTEKTNDGYFVTYTAGSNLHQKVREGTNYAMALITIRCNDLVDGKKKKKTRGTNCAIRPTADKHSLTGVWQ